MTEPTPTPVQTAPLGTPPHRDPLLLGRYRIMSSGTAGGFGTVLTCWDTRLQRRVAIKRMPLARPDMPAGTASAIEEALAEARTSSLLAHPNIVTVFDFEADYYFAYLVMEYVDGLTLTELLSRVEGGTLTPSECAYLMSKVAQALQYAHENGVLHLDLKPSNIMIDHSGTVKLCDFGMATLASATGWGGARGGTVGYMPPEQILGDVVDERTDIFALAVVTWQALTGQSPFDAPTAEASLKLIERGPKQALSKLVPGTEGMAEEAIMQALEANRAARLPSAEAFADELVFGLGDPAEGAESIRQLLAQANTDEADPATSAKAALPFLFRHPRLGPVLLRAGTAALTVPVTQAAAPALATLAPRGLALVSALVAAAAAAWPPLAPALALGMALAALTASVASAADAVVPLVTGGVLLAWWAAAGRKSHYSGLATLPACLLGQATAAPAVAALGMTPLAAGLTVAATGYLQAFYTAAAAAGFNVRVAAWALGAIVLTRGFFFATAGAAVAAAAGAAVTRRWGTVAAGIAGQAVCLAGVVAAQLAAAWAQNGSVSLSAAGQPLLIAVLLSIFACAATVLRGPLHADEEVGVRDELV